MWLTYDARQYVCNSLYPDLSQLSGPISQAFSKYLDLVIGQIKNNMENHVELSDDKAIEYVEVLHQNLKHQVLSGGGFASELETPG